MKHLLLLVSFLIFGQLGTWAESAKIILQHGDEATFFKSDQLQEAVDAAKDGDVINLNEGTFSSTKYGEVRFDSSSDYCYHISVNKNITFIGAGATKTIINNVMVIENNCSLTIEGIDILDFTNAGNVKKLYISRCKCRRLYISLCDKKYDGGYVFYPSYNIENLILSQCIISTFWKTYISGGKNGLISGIVQNCSIGDINVDGLSYNNCNIRGINNTYLDIKNSIISFVDQPYSNIEKCLYYTNSDYNYEYNWKSEVALFDNDGNCVLTDEQLMNAGYIGTDGTVIGINGGIGFSLIPNRPMVSDFKINVDSKTKKMRINLKVTGK